MLWWESQKVPLGHQDDSTVENTGDLHMCMCDVWYVMCINLYVCISVCMDYLCVSICVFVYNCVICPCLCVSGYKWILIVCIYLCVSALYLYECIVLTRVCYMYLYVNVLCVYICIYIHENTISIYSVCLWMLVSVCPCVSAYVWYMGRTSCGWITAQGEGESSLDRKEQMHQGLNILSKC